MKAFSPLLKLKQAKEFVWSSEQQKAFDQIKQCLASPFLFLILLEGHLSYMYQPQKIQLEAF